MNNILRYINIIFLHLAFSIAILSPVLKISGIELKIYYFVYFTSPFIIFIFQKKYFKTIFPLIKIIYIYWIFGISYVLILLVAHSVADLTFVSYFLALIPLSFTAIIFAIWFYTIYGSEAINSSLLSICIILSLNTIFIVISLVNVNFMDFLKDNIAYIYKQEEYSYIPRPSGLVYMGYGYLSVLYSFGSIFALILFNNAKTANKIILTFILFFLNITGIIISGRVGIFILLLFMLVLFKSDVRKYSRSLFILFSSVTIVSAIIFLYYINLIGDFDKILKWAFELFINIFNEEGFKSTTTSELLENHYSVIPDSAYQWILGDGYFNRSFVSTDVGYLQALNGGGIIMLLLLIIFPIILTYSNLKSIKYLKEKDYIAIGFLPVSFLILNFKDLYFISYFGNSLIMLYFSALFLLVKKPTRL